MAGKITFSEDFWRVTAFCLLCRQLLLQ